MSDHTLPIFSLQPEIKEIPLTQGKVAIVDAADYDWFMQWKWYAHQTPVQRTYYAMRGIHIPGEKRTTLYMHRLILEAKPGFFVDHIDGDGLNNTRGNLRFCTPSKNVANSRLSRNNTSGYKGVSWDKSKNKWIANIKLDYRTKFLGRFATPEEAARAYDHAARDIFGEFSLTNFPLSPTLRAGLESINTGIRKPSSSEGEEGRVG